ncbi:MAG: Hsp20/alpha crystallin family protein [Devosia sp.]
MTLKTLTPWSRTRRADTSDVTDPFSRLQDDMERLLGAVRTDPSWGPSLGLQAGGGLAVPTLDVCEDDGAVEVTLDVPGVAREDLDVAINDRILTVSGKREDEMTEGGKDKNYHRVERYRGEFVRRIALPTGIDDANVEARYEDGVLSIRLPKTPEARANQKRIEIKSASATA